MSFLTQLAESLWVTDMRLNVFGANIGHRMTIVRLPDGTLWLHSPVRCSRELCDEIATLGEVSDIVVPSRFHDSFIPSWFMTYQDARIVVAPHVADDHPRWPSSVELADRPLVHWGDDIAIQALGGIPRLNEYVFLHRPTRTLILADLAFYFPPGSRTGWPPHSSGSSAPTGSSVRRCSSRW